MKPHWRPFLAAFLLVGAVSPLIALSDPEANERERNQKAVENARKHPDYHARLKQELLYFRSLSPERQAKLRKLDKDLYAKKSAEYVRLERVLERYSRWYRSLSAEEKKSIDSASDNKERIGRIRELREKQWLAQLPQSQRARLEGTSGAERTRFVARLRDEEKKSRYEFKFWDDFDQGRVPRHRKDLAPYARKYFEDRVFPQLNESEKQALHDAEGHWPDFPRTLVRLADAHPSLPGPPLPNGVNDLPRLPPKLRDKLEKLNGEEFRAKLQDMARKNPGQLQRVAARFFPCRPEDFPPETRDFVTGRLEKALSKDDMARLARAEGKPWPAYPKMVLEMARKHHLEVPKTSLPDPDGYWNKYRDRPRFDVNQSYVSESVLRRFAETELTPEERDALHLSLFDLTSRDRLQKEYVKRHPEEWKALLASDEAKR